MLLSHERSVKKEDMDRAELDAFLRQITPREQFYLDNPGAPSPRFKTMEHRTVRGRDVLYFHLQELPNDEIHLRKDSRFTDVPYYMHSNININYIYDGHCDYLIDDKPITLYKGDVCIFDLDVVRRKLTLGPSDIVINLNMTNEFFGDSFFHKAGRQNLFSDFMVHLDENQAAIQAAQDALTAAQNKLEEIEQENKKAENDCSNLFTWASTYQNASFQQRQTILNQFIKEVRVGRDYDIEIILNVPLEEFEEFKSHSLSVRTPSGRKTDLKQAPVRGLGTPNGGIVVFDKTSGEAMNIMPKSSAHVTLRCQDE